MGHTDPVQQLLGDSRAGGITTGSVGQVSGDMVGGNKITINGLTAEQMQTLFEVSAERHNTLFQAIWRVADLLVEVSSMLLGTEEQKKMPSVSTDWRGLPKTYLARLSEIGLWHSPRTSAEECI